MGWQFKERATPRGPGLVHVHAIKILKEMDRDRARPKTTSTRFEKRKKIKFEMGWGRCGTKRRLIQCSIEN